jgi:transglutaminase-like putative cysteine protease
LFANRLQSLAGRLLFAIGELIQNRPIEDVIFFVTLLSIVYWIVGLVAGYWLIRYANYLAVVLPAGIIMLIIQIYDSFNPSRVWILALYLFLALLLLGRLNYVRNLDRWRRQRVLVAPGSSMDLNNGVLAAAAIIILIAWTLPTSFVQNPEITNLWTQVTKPWRKLREHLSDAFAAVQGTVGVGTEFYGSILRLGTRTPEGNDVIFSVRPLSTENMLPRYYWRARIYDHYEKGQWSSTSTAKEEFSPNQTNLLIPDKEMRTLSDFIFTNEIKNSILYSPEQPVWVSRSSQILFYLTPDEQVDVAAIRANRALEGGETYQTRAATINPTVVDLRTAGENYPKWITERYLQLPDGFSLRIREQAEQLSRGLMTPYDKAVVITGYLRKEIKYSATIVSPPTGRDPLEWVLFDLKEGFCTYYASADVLMLRSVGIPARLAVGFAQGKPNIGRVGYTVVRSNAHAWPEVYFPNYGWVEFEPTGNQDPLIRSVGSDDSTLFEDELRRHQGVLRPDDEPQILSGDSGQTPMSEQKTVLYYFLWIVYISIGSILAAWLWLLNRRRPFTQRIPVLLSASLQRYRIPEPHWLVNWLRWSELSPLERTFNIVNRSLRWLGSPSPIHDTPAERAIKLSKLIPAAASAIETLVTEYQVTLYSPNPGDLDKAHHANVLIFWHTIRTLFIRFYKTLYDRFTLYR